MYPDVIRSFIEQYLLLELPSTVDLDRITPIRNESVDAKLRVLFSDLIFELNTISGTSIYLLFEHKSFPDKTIENQLIKYMDTFELDYLKEHSEIKTPLTIVLVLIYHGSYNWNIRFSHNRLANLKFFDLSKIPDEQIRGTAILKIVLLILKYINSEELVTKFDMIIELFKELKDDQHAKEYIRSFSFYVEHAAKEEFRDMLEQKMRHYFTEEELESSTLIRELEAIGEKRGEKRGEEIGEKRGEKRGMEKGIDIGVKKGIDIGAEAARLILTTEKSDDQIATDTGLSVEKIRELRRKIQNIS